jgi:Cd2+/Zn2+-exporting ATPase
MSNRQPQKPSPGPHRCLVDAVAEVMAHEPSLEAVRFDRVHRTVSVATLGNADPTALEQRLTRRIQQVQPAPGSSTCCVIEGQGTCRDCPEPVRSKVALNLDVQHDAQGTTVARLTCPTRQRFWRWRSLPWPRWVPRKVELPDEADHARESKQQMLAAVLCALFGLAGWLMGKWAAADWASTVLFAVAYVPGAWFILHEVWERLRSGVLDVHFLMLAVAVGSAAIGHWDEGVLLLFLFSLSGALEHYAMGRTQKEIRALFRYAPKTATLMDAAGHERLLPVEDVEPGARLLIKPGQQVPVDAEVVKGRSAVDESNLTGESTPVPKAPGDVVLAGTLNVWGPIEAVALRPVQESALNKIIRLIQQAQHLKAPAQRFTDRFSPHYTRAVLGMAVLMFFVWWLGLGHPAIRDAGPQRSAFYRAMTVLVVASPCALVLSIPSAVLAAIAWGARHGILFRGGAAVEKLAQVQVVAMDKTGTLTTGELRVERVESFPPGREQQVAELAYALERLSTHPLARAVTRWGKQQGLVAPEVSEVESVPGLGLRARLNGQPVWLGRRDWLVDRLAQGAEAGAVPAPARQAIANGPAVEVGSSEVWLLHGDLAGRLMLRDEVRPQAKGLIQQLRRLGVHPVVLTGDRLAAARHLQTSLGLDDVRAELKPQQKVQVIEAFARQGLKVAIVGDGVNDAPSLAAAYVGVAMGARGSDAALEQAEVVLMNDRLENFLTAFRLSQRARRIIAQNLVVSLGTVLVLIGCALGGLIPLSVGVAAHEGSTVLVVLNSLRLLLGGACPRPEAAGAA